MSPPPTDAARRGPVARLLDVLALAARAGARLAIRAWIRLDVRDVHHVPAAGPVILAATHESHADAVAIGAAVQRPLHFLGDRGLVDAPVLGPFLPRLGMLPVDRGAADSEALELLAAHLRRGAAVVVFPEGARARDGRVHRPRSGVARLAEATGAPVVPVGLDGTGRAWPVGRRPTLLPDGPAGVRFGAPMAPPAGGPLARRAWTAALHDELVRLAGRPRDDAFAPVGGRAA